MLTYPWLTSLGRCVQNTVLEIDCHEQRDGQLALSYIAPVVSCRVENLNEAGWADYRWTTAGGQVVQAERKTWGEVLANLDSVEDQLRRQRAAHPEARLLFVLEGWVDEHMSGTTIIQPAAGKSGGIWARGHMSGTKLSRVYSWLYNVSEYLEVFQTGNYAQTCQWLVAAYKQDQKQAGEKTTFHRYFKDIVFHADPQVLQLMGLMPGLGEIRAKALITKFTTTWQVLNASPKQLELVPGIGPKLAVGLLRSVGRVDV